MVSSLFGTNRMPCATRLAPFVYILLLFISCTPEKSGEQTAESFPVMKPVRRDTVYIREYVADVQSAMNIEIRAMAGGYLESIHVDEGAYVQAGQILFTIHQTAYQQEVLKAEAILNSASAEAKAAEVELRNTEALVERGIVSASELELMKARLEALKSKIAEAEAHASAARLQLSFTRIKAPFAGFINRIPNKIGSLIEEGALLTTLSNTDEMLVYFTVSEKEFLELASQPGGGPGEVELVMANGERYPYRGKVETAESEVDRNTGSLAFRARFPNPEKILRHGSSGKIRHAQPLRDALLIPQKATLEVQENLFVYVLNADQTVALRRIVPAYLLTHVYVVASGVSAEEYIIREGIQRIQQGDVIVPDTIQSLF